MKTLEGNVTRAERRNLARNAGTLSKWRERDRIGVRQVIGHDAKGNQVIRVTQVVGAPK